VFGKIYNGLGDSGSMVNRDVFEGVPRGEFILVERYGTVERERLPHPVIGTFEGIVMVRPKSSRRFGRQKREQEPEEAVFLHDPLKLAPPIEINGVGFPISERDRRYRVPLRKIYAIRRGKQEMLDAIKERGRYFQRVYAPLIRKIFRGPKRKAKKSK
jgi:hypothetical protein